MTVSALAVPAGSWLLTAICAMAPACAEAVTAGRDLSHNAARDAAGPGHSAGLFIHRGQTVLGLRRWCINPRPTRMAIRPAATKAAMAAIPAMVPTVDQA